MPHTSEQATPARGYASLHTHSEFSELDGLAVVSDLIAAAVADGNPAIAITDHGSLGAHWKLANKAREAGLKPIHGLEAYLAFGSRHERVGGPVDPDDEDNEDLAAVSEEDKKAGRPTKRDKSFMHLTLLATSSRGWENLVRISNASADTVWYKPRIDLDLLAEHGEDIIVLTGCLGGPLAYHLNRAILSEARGMSATARAALVFETTGKSEDRDELLAQAKAENAAGAALRGQAREYLDKIVAAVGHDNVYVEVMDHGIPAQARVTSALRELAAEYDLPMVATNDAHFTKEGDSHAHEAWLAVGSKRTLVDPKRFKFHGSGHHMRTEAEMRALFDGEAWWQEAVDNTVVIAERIDAKAMPAPKTRMPKFPVPAGFATSADYLRHLVIKGAVRRYGGPDADPALGTKQLSQELRDRIGFEFNTIVKQGFPDYFLIVADIIAWARSQGIRVGPGRGSAAGSVISYALGIVNVDPIRHGLLFERFLDVDRAGIPDIDVDFEVLRRAEVLAYFAAKWGTENVAQLGTFGLARTKAAIKDAARVLGMSVSLAESLTKKVPVKGGKAYSFQALDDRSDNSSAAFWEIADGNGNAEEILSLAREFEDITKGSGVHACGVVLSDEPLTGLVPLRKNASKDAPPGAPRVSVWDGKDIEQYGLVKMDFLGLRNLDVATLCAKLIKETTDEAVEPDLLDPDNPEHPERAAKTWAMLQEGRTAGVFQLDSSGMTELCVKVIPETIDDVCALVALYRPGPMGAGMHMRYAARKNGLESIDYGYLTTDPAEQAILDGVLKDTYGTICYQEQLMQLGGAVAGFGPAEKNALRVAVSKKKAADLAKVGAQWMEGGLLEILDESGAVLKPAFAERTLRELWRTFQASAEYLFNKSHSAAYAQIAYMTAYLKANWPSQYGAALLACTENDDKRLKTLRDLAADDQPVFAPDVNTGSVGTTSDGTSIWLGLSEVKGVGKNAATIVNERQAAGPFASLADLLARCRDIEGKLLTISSVEALIDAGAFDAFGPRLAQMMVARASRGKDGEAVILPLPDAEWGVLERAARQRDRLGCVLGVHPLTALGSQLRGYLTPGAHGRKPQPLHKLSQEHGSTVVTLGIVASVGQRAYRGGQMANLQIEGTKASLEATLWNKEVTAVVERYGRLPEAGDMVSVLGKVNVREREVEKFNPDGTTTIEVETQSSLSVWELWPVPVEDEARVMAPTAGAYPRLRLVDPVPADDEPVAATAVPPTFADDSGEGDESDSMHFADDCDPEGAVDFADDDLTIAAPAPALDAAFPDDEFDDVSASGHPPVIIVGTSQWALVGTGSAVLMYAEAKAQLLKDFHGFTAPPVAIGYPKPKVTWTSVDSLTTRPGVWAARAKAGDAIAIVIATTDVLGTQAKLPLPFAADLADLDWSQATDGVLEIPAEMVGDFLGVRQSDDTSALEPEPGPAGPRLQLVHSAA